VDTSGYLHGEDRKKKAKKEGMEAIRLENEGDNITKEGPSQTRGGR